MLLMGRLSRWLSAECLDLSQFTTTRAEEFLDSLRAGGQRRVPTFATLGVLLDYLRDQKEVPPKPPKMPTPRDELLARYRHHLVHDRGLTPSTVLRYERMARRFLAERAGRTGVATGVEELTAAEVNAYLLEVGSRLVVASAKREAADLRALLRFLYLEGILDADLGGAMPPVAT